MHRVAPLSNWGSIGYVSGGGAEELVRRYRCLAGSSSSWASGCCLAASSRHLPVNAGLTFDFNVETTNVEPVALGVIRF